MMYRSPDSTSCSIASSLLLCLIITQISKDVTKIDRHIVIAHIAVIAPPPVTSCTTNAMPHEDILDLCYWLGFPKEKADEFLLSRYSYLFIYYPTGRVVFSNDSDYMTVCAHRRRGETFYVLSKKELKDRLGLQNH
jgi:hypothetical protein